MPVYPPTLWQNNQVPAMNATNLNKLTNELKAQALDKSISHTLPTWANNIAPAVSDSAPLNEMERVTQAVAVSLGLSYTVTSWQSGWLPARNATNLNKLENQAQANRAAIDAGSPALTPLGINPNAGGADGGAWTTALGTLGAKWIRNDTISSAGVTWAGSHSASFLGLTTNQSASQIVATVNAWPAITTWELDNEPYFFGVTVATWAQAMLSAAQQVKAAHPAHKLIVPLLVQTNGGDYQTGGVWSPWVDQVLNAAPTLPNFIDGWSMHPYPTPSKADALGQGSDLTLSVVDKVYNQLVARSAQKPIWITEFGWSVGTSTAPSQQQVTLANQANNLNSAITSFRSRTWIAAIILYCLQTWGTGYEQSFGIFESNQADRPAAATFRTRVSA